LTSDGQRKIANSRGPESVRRFAEEIGATAADVNGAVAGVDAIFLSIPLPAMAELPNGLLKALQKMFLLSIPATTILECAIRGSRRSTL
jgi:predicted dinucleotide-binding enzyme